MDVQVARHADPVEWLVAQSHERHGAAIGSFEIGRTLADIGKSADTFESQAFRVEGLTKRQVDVITAIRGWRTRYHVGGEVDSAFIAAQHRDGIAGVAILTMSGQLDADLIIAVAKIVRTARYIEVINLIDATIVRQEKEPFFRN